MEFRVRQDWRERREMCNYDVEYFFYFSYFNYFFIFLE